jgi:hypothetical protein
MQPPRLIGSGTDYLQVASYWSEKYLSRHVRNSYRYFSTAALIYAYTTGVWVEGFDYIAVKVDEVWFTTKGYKYRFRTLLDFREEQVEIITLQELKELVKKRTISINTMEYKSLREKRIDMAKFNQFICELPRLNITDVIPL